MENNVVALDVSMKCTGISVFTNDGEHLLTTSIETDAREERRQRLRNLYVGLREIRKEYNPVLAVFEEGFFRYIRSTQVLFRAIGVAQLAFWDVKQIYYPSTQVKLIVAGVGNATKEMVHLEVGKRYPNVVCKNLDESDSLSVGMAYFIQKGKGNGTENIQENSGDGRKTKRSRTKKSKTSRKVSKK